MKIKNTIVWATCRRWRFVSISGRTRSIAAPVVPMKLASNAPTAMKAVFVRGWAGRSPAIRMPPLIVYKLNNSTMNGIYSLASVWISSEPREKPAVGCSSAIDSSVASATFAAT